MRYPGFFLAIFPQYYYYYYYYMNFILLIIRDGVNCCKYWQPILKGTVLAVGYVIRIFVLYSPSFGTLMSFGSSIVLSIIEGGSLGSMRFHISAIFSPYFRKSANRNWIFQLSARVLNKYIVRIPQKR